MRSSILPIVSFAVLASACDEPAAPQSRSVAAPVARSSTVTGPRLVILGFDGVDPRRVDRLVAQGKLPALARLGERGYRGELRSTNPPQSPVAWSAFATGLPAGTHGIFDFVGRNPETYFPEIATTRVTHAELHGDEVTPAFAENLRRGEAFWDVIARAGVPVEALRVPYNFPLPADGATALAGLGAPDARGINSSFTLLTADAVRAAEPPPAGGQVSLLTATGESWQATLEGPTVKVDGRREKTFAPLSVRAAGRGLRIDVAGGSQTLGIGETGPYVVLRFVPSPALTVSAATRFTVRAGAPAPELYVEPLSIVPDAPYVGIANPARFGVDLWRAFGPFKTVGWIDDTSALGGDAMDEAQFLREALGTMRLEEKLLADALEKREHKVILSVSVSTDRIGHMFYRYVDAVRPEPAADPAYARALDDAYLEMDRIVAATEKLLAPDDVLVIMSDHGFASFRRGFNLNTWLAKEGFLVLERGVKAPRDFFADVDWSRTKAYALGTGSIYVNVRGREARGSVSPADAPKVARAIARRLLKVRDGKAGRVVLDAYLGDELYVGPERDNAPDVRVALAEGYRASWSTSLGGMPAALFEDNTKKWSGDHASSRPEDVPGILVVNRPIAVQDPGIEDVAATAYLFASVPPPPGLIGRPLLRTDLAAAGAE